jgi:hypothetical protein
MTGNTRSAAVDTALPFAVRERGAVGYRTTRPIRPVAGCLTSVSPVELVAAQAQLPARSDEGGILVSADHHDPIGVVDRQLWREAQDMLSRHVQRDSDGHCGCCGRTWPCTARRVGERAEVAAFQWNEAWTVRNDMLSMRAV